MRVNRGWLFVAAAVIALLAIILAARAWRQTEAIYGATARQHLWLNFQDLRSPHLGPYYVDLGGDVATWSVPGAIGAAGVPVASYGGRIQSNPVDVAQYSFEVFHEFIAQHRAGDKEKFLRQADWLERHCKTGCVYRFAHPPQIYQQRWLSALAQGEVISVELRAYQLTHESKYLRVADESYKLLVQPIAAGGTSDATPDGVWFEEYPQNPPTHVLNGDMFALLGIWDYYRVTKRPSVKNFFNRGIAAVRRGLIKSDTGFWCRYDLRHAGLCSREYLDIEIAQAELLADIADDSSLRRTAKRFQSYESASGTLLKIRLYDWQHPKGFYEIFDSN